MQAELGAVDSGPGRSKWGRFVFSRLPFVTVLLLEVAYFVWLLLGRRLAAGHDTLQVFALQHFFVTNLLQAGEVAQWHPLVAHGTTTSMWFALQGNPFTYALGALPLPKLALDFLTWFHVGVFLEHLLLLTGSWLWLRTLGLSSRTVLFVCVGLLGTSVWTLQLWYPLRLFAALPLIFYCLERFLVTRRLSLVALAGAVFGLQALGNLPYFLPVSSLVVAVYSAALLAERRELLARSRWQDWSWPRALAALLPGGCLLALVYVAMTAGEADLVKWNYGRNADSTTSLEGFLHYAGNLGWQQWSELVTGLSPAEDYTMFAGFAALPLIVIGLFSARRLGGLRVVVTGIFCALLASGSVVSIAAYHLWPLMNYYRHLALLAPLVKLFLLVVAGFGFEALVRGDVGFARSLGRWQRWQAGLAVVVLIGATGVVWWLSAPSAGASAWLRALWTPAEEPALLRIPAAHLAIGLRMPLWGLIATCMVVVFAAALAAGSRWRARLVFALLALHTANLCLYRLLESNARAMRVPLAAESALRTTLPTFLSRRTEDIPRDAPGAVVLATREVPGMLYWTLNSLLRVDTVGTPLRADQWTPAFDAVLRAFEGSRGVGSRRPPESLAPLGGIDFPLDHPAAGVVTGVAADKLQVFTSAVELGESAVAEQLTAPDFTGDTLLLVSDGQMMPTAAPVDRRAAGGRREVAYEVVRFDANHLDVQLDVGPATGQWLYYADCWHPAWRAWVNGRPVAVRRAQLGYKAVPLDAGANRVQFQFAVPGLSVVHRLLGVCSLLGLLALVATSLRLAGQGEGGRTSLPGGRR